MEERGGLCLYRALMEMDLLQRVEDFLDGLLVCRYVGGLYPCSFFPLLSSPPVTRRMAIGAEALER